MENARKLQGRIQSVHAAESALRRRFGFAIGFLLVCAIGLAILYLRQSSDTRFQAPWVVIGWLIACVTIPIACSYIGRKFSLRGVVHQVENRYPDLEGRLETALGEMQAGKSGYLNDRLISETLTHAENNNWTATYRKPLRIWTYLSVIAAVILFCLLNLQIFSLHIGSRTNTDIAENPPPPEITVSVLPGDTEVERGSRLLVEARFQNGIPSDAEIQVLHPETRELLTSHAMRQSMGDPVFGGVIPNVEEPVLYQVAWGETSSQTHKLDVYIRPELQQADATITPPEWTRQDASTIEDVRKVTVLEGSELQLRFQLNKPIAEAELFGEDETIIPLIPSETDPTVLVAEFLPENELRYRLHLVDEEDRTNAEPPWLSVKIQRNERPNVRVAFPGTDVEASAIEEVDLEGRVWDDLGLNRVGATIAIGETVEEILFTEEPLPGKEKHDFATLLDLEARNVEPGHFVTFHFWAEDFGPDGTTRRTESDLYFAEIRHWEEIYREGVPQEGEGGEPSQTSQLRIQQKEIINATWKIKRQTDMGGLPEQLENVEVVRESQEIVASNVEQVLAETQDARIATLLTNAKEQMDIATQALTRIQEDQRPEILDNALKSERKAYQYLLQAETREFEITQSQSQSSSSSQSQSQQRQLMQLELEQEENRYETASQAESEQQNTAQEEDLAVLTQLKELARREEALAEKLKEIEAALEAAETEEEREELERQLKRLQEEQEQMLRDVDDLLERMDQQENQERMAESREQLAEVRENVQEANESLQSEQLSEAANSATRAQRELEELENEFRERTSSQFAEDMREMRDQARNLAETQEQIAEELEQAAPTDRNTLNLEAQMDNMDLSRQFTQQQKNLEELLEQMRQVSQQSEESEPVLSDELYEAVRNTRMQATEENLSEAALSTRYGSLLRAQESEREASRAIDELVQNVEQAAEGVLGSEADALRMARNELDEAIEALQQEQQRVAGNNPSEPGTQDETEPSQQLAEPGISESPESENAGQNPQPGEQPAEGQTPGEIAQSGPPSPEGQQPGEQPAEGQSSQPGSPSQESQQPGEQPGGRGETESQMARESYGQSGQPSPSQNQGQPQPGGQTQTATAATPQLFFQQQSTQEGGASTTNPGPLTGDNYDDFADNLRTVEEILEVPEMRSAAARVLDRARAMRMEHERNDTAPQWDVVATNIVDPLTELRDRVSEELARLDADQPLVPIDRDPVPGEFRQLVRQYYEKLASGE